MKKNHENENSNNLVISYLTLRRSIGILALTLPFILLIGSIVCGGCEEIQQSISGYYHTAMRNVLVGVLCAVALFLFSYRGYELRDNIAGDLAALFALGVAFFPTSSICPLPNCNIAPVFEIKIISTLHFVSATLFFLTLSYFSLVLFTKSNVDKKNIKQPKKNRDFVYKVCGYIMLSCIGLIAFYFFVLDEKYIAQYNPVFWLETIALMAFGFSWLTKGEVLWIDVAEEDDDDENKPIT